MSAGDTQPTEPLPEWAYVTPEPRRRRVWPWVVALIVLVVLLIVGWYVAERIARDIVESTIRTQITTNMALPPQQEIAVDVPGAIIPQLVVGTFREVRISSEDVAFDAFEGDVAVVAYDVPVRGGSVGEASGEVRMDEDQLRQLMSQVPGFPTDDLGLDDPDITASTDITVLGLPIPIGIALTPSAMDGELVLTPAALRLGAVEITAGELYERFGGLVEGVVKAWPVCIARYIPQGLTLTDVEVDGALLVARFAIDGDILVDPSLAQNGTC